MNPSGSNPDFQSFRDSITPDLNDVSRYIDWDGIERDLGKFEPAIRWLQIASTEGNLRAENLGAALSAVPRLYELAAMILALPQSAVGFNDGRELPEPGKPATWSKPEQTAQLLLDLGLSRLLPSGTDVSGLVRGTLAGLDAGKRRYRLGATIKERLKIVLDDALRTARDTQNLNIEKAADGQWPSQMRGRLDAILSLEGRQRIGIATVFQTASGGRQSNELSTVFPALQREMADFGLNLILVADGRGVRLVHDSVLRSLFAGVGSCMTFRQAASGRLLEETVRLIRAEPPTQENRALKSIIHAAITAGNGISATELPADSQRGRVAIASYAADNTDLALTLSPDGASLSWERSSLVREAASLRSSFVRSSVFGLFAKLIEATPEAPLAEAGGLSYSVLNLSEGETILPRHLLVTASGEAPTVDVARQVAQLAFSKTGGALVAILLAPTAPEGEAADNLRRLQSSLTANVVILTLDVLQRMAQSKETPRGIVAQQLLEQSDLVKSSPFVLNSVTPGRMFYGRETEEADMVATLNSNSIALLGGRRIGKTSLMRHVEHRLQEGGFQTFFCDCQTVRDWDGFGEVARRLWGLDIPKPFRPVYLLDLIKRLKSEPQRKAVFLLDEIDQLLDWDKKHVEDQVPEAFFRACRTVSQEGLAQFVFSGERTIADRLWDPQSPHWNLCQPRMLRQLDKNAAKQLLLKPLRSMQIVIADETTFSEAAWIRTSGHPQLLQTVGYLLIRHLNERLPNERGVLSFSDLQSVTDVWSYAEAYLETYWGQATPLERLLTVLVAGNRETLDACRAFLAGRGVERTDAELRAAFRMIELYGITDASDSGYRVRLEWLNSALSFYGTTEKLVELYAGQLK